MKLSLLGLGNDSLIGFFDNALGRMEESELSDAAGRNVKQWGCFENEFRSSKKYCT